MQTGELLRRLASVSAKVLAEQLRGLEVADMVKMLSVQGRGLAVHDVLTELGRSLRPMIDLMCAWGRLNLSMRDNWPLNRIDGWLAGATLPSMPTLR